MGNTFWIPCPEIMGTHQKLFLDSVKTSWEPTSYTITALDCQMVMQIGVIGFNLAN